MKPWLIAASLGLAVLAAGAAEREAPAPLPDLGGRTDEKKQFPLVDPFRWRERQTLGPRPYWERDPLFTPAPSP